MDHQILIFRFQISSNGGTVQSIDPDKIDNQSKKFNLELKSNMLIDSNNCMGEARRSRGRRIFMEGGMDATSR